MVSFLGCFLRALLAAVVARTCVLGNHFTRLKTPGTVSEEAVTERGEVVCLEEEVDKVVSSGYVCCGAACLLVWKYHFGAKVARAIVATYRAAYARVDKTQQRIFHVEKLTSVRIPTLVQPVHGGPKELIGEYPA